MAGTVSTHITVDAQNGYFREPWDYGSQSYTQATVSGPPGVKPIQSIGFAAEEVVSLGDLAVADQGLILLKNLDTTNYIDWGPESAGAMVAIGRLLPGEEAVFRAKPSVILRAQANTAACLLQILALAR